MLEIPGYTLIEKLHKSNKTLVYRALREKDKQSVILKILTVEHPSSRDLERLEREYETIRSLKIPDVAQAYSFEKLENVTMLVLEDIGGHSLGSYISKQRFPLEQFLEIAIKLMKIVGQIHDKAIIHKDLKPENIIYNPDKNILKIIDFSISTSFPKESKQKRRFSEVEGTLAYVSPEQTGWMNRLIDYRTDFYTLGVTLYEMLLGTPPFQYTDPLELIHAHLARQPEEPSLVDPEIPEIVSSIILKLLSKNAEDRYKTASGIQFDFENCLKQLKKSGEIHPFVLGTKDISDRFQIPQKIYGRHDELELLREAYSRASKRTAELVLISGEPGIGKSALVQEMYKPVVQNSGFFISGKFEQYKRDIPHNAFIGAFEDLANQILTRNPDKIRDWKNKILETLGANASVIINMVPKLELVIGKQPQSAELTSLELQNRFHLIFQNFLAIFASEENPLVIFIDDLQWADSSSLKLIEILMTNPEFRHLLFVCAYREQEIKNNIPLTNAINKIKEFRHNYTLYTGRKLPVEHIHLDTITPVAISTLIQETLSCRPIEGEELAELVFAQTAGNPFFVNQFLTAVHHEGLIQYNTENRKWTWDIPGIKKKGFTDNVIQLMAANIAKASETTGEILQLASCIGNHFDLETLSILRKKSRKEVSEELAEAIQEEFIFLIDDEKPRSGNLEFQFQHDQILYTAYSLIEAKKKKQIHLELGRLMLERLSAMPVGVEKPTKKNKSKSLTAIGKATVDEKSTVELLRWLDGDIFSIVNHINIGCEILENSEEKTGVIALNLLAARKARKSAAFESALDYLNIGLKLLPKNSWKSNYFLTLQVYSEAAECEYISTNFTDAERLCQVILENAQSVIDKVKVFEITIASLTPQNKFNEAIEAGRDALLQLGVKLPKHPNQLSPMPDIILAYFRMAHRLDKITELPSMQDPKKLAAMNIMVQLITPSFISVPDLFPVLVLKMVHLTLKYGLSNQSAYAFAFYGMILGSGMGRYDAGDQLAQVAFKILEKLPPANFDCKVLFVSGNMVYHWKNPLSEGRKILENAYRKGLDSGDLLFASYSLNWYSAYNYLMRKFLPDTLEEMKKYKGNHEKIKQKDAADFYSLWMQFVDTMSTNGKMSGKIKGTFFDEEVGVKIWEDTNNDTDLFTFHLMKGIIFYLKKVYTKSLEHLEQAIPHASGVFGMPVIAEHNFFYSLTLASMARNSPRLEKTILLKKVEANQKKLKIWAKNSPINYRHKYLIVEGELFSIRKSSKAIYYFEQAIQSAIESKFLFEQALANELMSQHYSSIKKQFIANSYLRESYIIYLQWGAYAKASELEEEFPESIGRKGLTYGASLTSSNATTKSTSETIDLKTVLKVSQNISSEIDLDRLTEKLVLIAIENAGADRGYLLLEQEGRLFIEAEGEKSNVKVVPSFPAEKCEKLAQGVVNYVKMTKEAVVINDTSSENQFQSDPYIIEVKPKSVLCFPVMKVNKLLGILYLENNLLSNVFTAERLDILNLLTTQAIISLENAMYVKKIKTINKALENEIVQHKKTESDLIQTKERYALAARGANDGLWDWDLVTDRIYYSPRWKSILGYKEDEIQDYPNEWFSRVHEEDISMLRSSIDSHLEGVLPHLECEYRMRHKDGRYLWMITRGLAVRDDHDVPYRIAGSQTEITKRKNAEEQLRHDAMHDTLTGLPNWNLLLDRMDHAIKRKNRQADYLFAVLFIDIDRFKVINDSLGHEMGNQLLIKLSKKIEECLRPEDTVARLGGDEFGILLESIVDINDAIHVIKRLRENLAEPFPIRNHELFVTISIGMVVSSGEYKRPEDIIRDADTAMHRAKSQGRNRYEIFDKTMHANVIRYLKTEGDLRKALEREELKIHYQPIVAAKDGKIVGLEALLRWNSPEESISPEEFIPLAEENGLILPIGEWVLNEACKQMKMWHDMGFPPIEISVNISGRQFAQKDFVDVADRAILNSGLDPKTLTFELTESVLMDNVEHATWVLEELRKRKIKVAIDDFGTGYSSLNYLKQFHVQKLKIDRSFIQNMVTNTNDAALIKAIIAMGESMQMRVIAEGVENLEQLKFLQKENCNEIQGFYFSKPLTANEFEKLYEKQKSFPTTA